MQKPGEYFFVLSHLTSVLDFVLLYIVQKRLKTKLSALLA